MKNKINVHPYLGQENPAVDYIVRKFLPTFKNKVQKILSIKSKRINKEFFRDDLPNNTNVLPLSELSEIRENMISNLNDMCEILDGKKPIVFIADSCFTNQLLIKQLFNILFEDFDRFVDIVEIDYENPLNNLHLKDKVYNNSIIILGGSFSDTYTIPDSMYSGPLFDLIKDLSSDTVPIELNNKILGVCFGQQYINNIMGIDRILSERMMTTIKGVSQFGMMPFEFDKNVKKVPYIYKGIVSSLSNHGQNKSFTGVLTRTGHVDFNLLDSYTVNSSSVVNIVNDTITGSPVIWGTKNGNILGNQAHLEVNLFEDLKILEEETIGVLPFLEGNYGKNIGNILDNITPCKRIANSMGDIFYISSLNSLAFGITSKHNKIEENKNKKNEFTYYTKTVCDNFDDILLEGVSQFNFNMTDIGDSYIEALDKQGKLKMLTTLDWKVSRGLNEIGKTLGLGDMKGFIQEHKTFIESLQFIDSSFNVSNGIKINTAADNNVPYVFRDFGAGNGELVKEVDQIDGISAYGIGDYAYFDLYEGIKKHDEFRDIPHNLLKILIQELFEHFKEDDNKTYPELIGNAMDKVTFKTEEISDSSMFSDKTDMFNDTSKTLTKIDKDFIENNSERLEEIKNFIKNNFYNFVEGYFKKLMISDFGSLFIKDKYLKQSDFQTAIRSTSHIEGGFLEKTLNDYIEYNSKAGSIYFDNGVVRSYSSVPRIKEYIDLENSHNNVKIYFTYDKNSNYISSAVILKEPYIQKEIIEKYLDDNIILLNSNDLYDNSFFRIERFYRELIILTFKNYKVFYNKNKDIIKFLKFLSIEIKTMDSKEIKKVILEGINNLVISINNDYGEDYYKLSMDDLNFYIGITDPSIKMIFDGNINIQEWFNTDFNRNN